MPGPSLSTRRAGKEQEKERSWWQPGMQLGMQGGLAGEQLEEVKSKHLSPALPAPGAPVPCSRSRFLQPQLTRNQPLNPKKTDPNPKENTGTGPGPAGFHPHRAGSSQSRVHPTLGLSVPVCPSEPHREWGGNSPRQDPAHGNAHHSLHPKALGWIFPLQLELG